MSPPERESKLTVSPDGGEATNLRRAGVGAARDELERIAHEYHRIREEHRRARHGGRTERRLGARLEELGERFERLLAEAGLDESARQRWRDHLRNRGTRPGEGPGEALPLLFSGRSEAGSELRLLARDDGTVDALVDGALVERLDGVDELGATAPGLRFRLGGSAFRETFASSATARAALRESIETGTAPGPAVVEELVADGIADRDLALTPRGRRALALDLLPAHRLPDGSGTLTTTARGPVPRRARRQLEEMLAGLAGVASRPILHARASLVQEEDPALERPVVAKARLELAGRVVRAHTAAATAAQAIDLLETRLRRNLLDLAEREEAARREGRPARPGAWRHGDLPAARPGYVERAPEERQILRRKTFAAEPVTAEEAAWEMRLLDHDFHLFVDAGSGEDALVYLRDDGVHGLKRTGGDGGYVEPVRIDPEPVSTLSVAQAIERLDTTQERFLFFVDDDDRRGAVLYRRYDGHYGLVTAAPPGA